MSSNFDANSPDLIQNLERLSSTGRSYYQNLQYISNEAGDRPYTFEDRSTHNSMLNSLIDAINTSRSARGLPPLSNSDWSVLDGFFNQYNAVTGKKMPTTWEGFITALYSYYGVKGIDANDLDSSLSDFADAFSRMAGFPTDLGHTGGFGSGVIDIAGSDSISQFKAAFAEFLRTLPYNGASITDPNQGKIAGDNTSSTYNFFSLFNQFLQPITTTTSQSAILAYDSTSLVLFPEDYNSLATDGTGLPDQWIAQYDLFFRYFGDPKDELHDPIPYESDAFKTAFAAEFNDYYEETVKKYGYFHPGHALDGWISRMWDKFQSDKYLYGTQSSVKNIEINTLDAQGNPTTQNILQVVTSVSSIHSKRVIVLDRIFRLLALMIGSLQKVAAAQAQQITFLSNWQRVFTDMITQIETFTRGDKSLFGKVSTDSTLDSQYTQDRGDANQAQINRRETLSAWRGIVQDTAKREQTRVNQSQDAVSQQANIASSIIQQLTTILGTIFR